MALNVNALGLRETWKALEIHALTHWDLNYNKVFQNCLDKPCKKGERFHNFMTRSKVDWVHSTFSISQTKQVPKMIFYLNSMNICYHNPKSDTNITTKLFGQLSLLCLVEDLDFTVETLYSTIYYSKYFIELNFDKSTQYVALWTHKRHPIPRPFGRAMECLLWVLQQKLTVL